MLRFRNVGAYLYGISLYYFEMLPEMGANVVCCIIFLVAGYQY